MIDSYPIKQFLIDHPLPWRLSQTGPTCVEAANDAYVCDGAGASGGAFIVEACNGYETLLAQRDALLTACKLAKERLDQLGMDWMGSSPDPLEKAIANAKGTIHA